MDPTLHMTSGWQKKTCKAGRSGFNWVASTRLLNGLGGGGRSTNIHILMDKYWYTCMCMRICKEACPPPLKACSLGVIGLDRNPNSTGREGEKEGWGLEAFLICPTKRGGVRIVGKV